MRSTFAKKSFGQNFLVDQSYISKIIAAVNPKPLEKVIEIGPGRGALTEPLLRSGADVIAVELEREMIAFLKSKFIDEKTFRLVEGDALQIVVKDLLGDGSKAKVVANLPYNVSTAILQRLAEQRDSLDSLVLMFQREVVERISAKPGDKARGFLTVLVESAFSVERLFDVTPTAFDPQPKVWSSVVRLIPATTVIADEAKFRKLVSTAFVQKRKTLLNNLKGNYPDIQATFDLVELDGRRRAETLTLGEWVALHEALRQN
jgi:16S rRNA (adenine1518-N6/adenine1519-N6)-dimethyltransferase